MGEEGRVIKIPAAACVIGHGVDRAGDVVVLGNVAVVTLVEGVQP